MSDTSDHALTERPMIFIDMETSGLDSKVHEPIEVAWWKAGTDPYRIYELTLPHTLALADKIALDVNNYHHRELWDRSRWCLPEDIDFLREQLTGATLVGAQVDFDAGFLERITGKVWHYRFMEFESWVAGRMNLTGVFSLRDCVTLARARGIASEESLPMPAHTAMTDVRAMQKLWMALR